MKEKSIAYPIIFMTALTAVTVLLLALLNQSTMARVQENEKLELMKKIFYVFNLEDKYQNGQSSEEIIKSFNDSIEEKEDADGRKIYVLTENNQPVAYALPFDGPGLWGSINGYIGVDADMKTITGVDFIKQSETPGLGGRISESPYKEQYRNVDISNASDKFIINRPAAGGNIDAIAGATQTSTFVQNMINEDLKTFVEKGVN